MARRAETGGRARWTLPNSVVIFHGVRIPTEAPTFDALKRRFRNVDEHHDTKRFREWKAEWREREDEGGAKVETWRGSTTFVLKTWFRHPLGFSDSAHTGMEFGLVPADREETIAFCLDRTVRRYLNERAAGVFVAAGSSLWLPGESTHLFTFVRADTGEVDLLATNSERTQWQGMLFVPAQSL